MRKRRLLGGAGFNKERLMGREEYILADSSVWIQHFRTSQLRLVEMLQDDRIVIHPWIMLELSLGSVPDRSNTLRDLAALRLIQEVPHEELRAFVEQRTLYFTGLGAVDVALMAACLVSNVELWTYDKQLSRVWGKLSN